MGDLHSFAPTTYLFNTCSPSVFSYSNSTLILTYSASPTSLYATARLVSPAISEIGDDFSAAADSLAWSLSCSSSPLIKFLCLIIVMLAIVATAAREAFKMNNVLKPFVYPFSKMKIAVDDGIPRVEGEASEDGLLMMAFIKAEGRANLCMAALNELLLWDHKNNQREKKINE